MCECERKRVRMMNTAKTTAAVVKKGVSKSGIKKTEEEAWQLCDCGLGGERMKQRGTSFLEEGTGEHNRKEDRLMK